MQKDQTNHSAEKSTEDKVVNIDDIVKESKGDITHLEAVEDFITSNEDIEPETVASLIQRNQKLKAILYENAEQLNLVAKQSRLPIDEG